MYWAQFTSLPNGVDEAAKASTTIWYQREITRRFCRNENIKLLSEELFMDVRPDRGSPEIEGPLRKIFAACEKSDAFFLYVNFSGRFGTRSHSHLRWCIEDANVEALCLPAETIRTASGAFDIYGHFRNWKAIQEEHTRQKESRKYQARGMATHLRRKGLTFREIAVMMNERDILSATGKTWTADSLRKFLASAADTQARSRS